MNWKWRKQEQTERITLDSLPSTLIVVFAALSVKLWFNWSFLIQRTICTHCRYLTRNSGGYLFKYYAFIHLSNRLSIINKTYTLYTLIYSYRLFKALFSVLTDAVDTSMSLKIEWYNLIILHSCPCCFIISGCYYNGVSLWLYIVNTSQNMRFPKYNDTQINITTGSLVFLTRLLVVGRFSLPVLRWSLLYEWCHDLK